MENIFKFQQNVNIYCNKKDEEKKMKKKRWLMYVKLLYAS